MRCSSCEHENRETRRFCAECGAALAAPCPSCGASNEPGEKFCGGCGARLLPAQAPAPHTAPTTTPPPAPDSALPEGERRQLTVIFCDLVGSTPLSQQLDAEEWREIIARYQSAASEAVVRFGGHVAKNLGDGLLIYFGWPAARGNDPERAARAGLAILRAMIPLNEKLASEGAPRLSVRVGMHTGPVVIADGGEVFGETANISARVQGAAEPDTVVITEATQRLVAGMFVVEDLGAHALKGVREPMTLYRVLRPGGVRSRLDVAVGRLSAFVGREAELATLVDRWERAQEGEGQNVLVLGEAGVGKSRLAYQLRERLAAVPHTWLECGATPYTEGTPFHPAVALISQGLGLAPEEADSDNLGKIERGLGGLGSPEAVSLLAEFVGIPPPAPLTMSPDLQRHSIMNLLSRWILAMSEAQPIVVLVEDLHWCDASSLELLGRMVAQSATARLLFIATARPEFTPPWPARENVTTLQLARLTKRQAREMAVALGGAEFPEQTLDALVARAGGVPLYVEELTKSLAEPGAAQGVEAIPATLADSLMARLDRLSTVKEVAQRAAVLGREFSYSLLAAVAGMEDAALRAGLGRLVEAEIVFVRGEPPEATYTFKHALVQEAAYDSLLRRTRQQLHARVVDVIGAKFPERAAAEPELVARHAEAAGRIDEAIALYQRAGEQGQDRSAHAEAKRHLEKALALLATLPESRDRDVHEATLLLTLSGPISAARGYAHADLEEVADRARALSEAAGEARLLGHALNMLSISQITRGDLARGAALADRVLAISRETGDGGIAIRGHGQLGQAHYYQGHFASSLAHCDAVEALCASGQGVDTRTLTLDPHVSGLCYAAWNLLSLGWPDRALARAREATRFARGLEHPMSLCQCLFFETVVHWLRGEWAAQRERAEETMALCESMEFPFWLSLASLWHAASRVRESGSGALADMEAALALGAQTGSRAGVPALFALLADAHWIAGKPAEAGGIVETGLAVAVETGQHFYDAELHRFQAKITLALGGASDDAEAAFDRAIDVARGQEAKWFEVRAATGLARLWRDQGKRAEARDLLAPVYAWFTEGFETRDLGEAKALLDELSG